MRPVHPPLVLGPLCLFCLFLSPLLAIGPLDLRLEVMTGQDLPYLPGRQFWDIFGFRANSAGRVVFGGLTRANGEKGYPNDIGVFLKDGDVTRKVLHAGDTLPDGAGVYSAGSFESAALDINESGTVAIVITKGILVDNGTGLRWLVRLGAGLPNTSLTITGFPMADTRAGFYGATFLADSGAVTFAAQLSDGTQAVLKTSTNGLVPLLRAGQPLPDRPGSILSADTLFYRLIVRGDVSAFMAATETKLYVFLHDGVTIHTVAAVADALSSGKKIRDILELQVNRAGIAVLATRLSLPSGDIVPAILKWSATAGLSEVVNQEFALRRYPGLKATELVYVSIDDAGRLFFGAVFARTSAAVVMIEDDKVEVIAADGDPTPLGGTFRLLPSVPINIDPIPPPSFTLRVSETNGREEIAFAADVNGGEYTGVPFLWSRGILFAVPLQGEEIEGIGDQEPLRLDYYPDSLNLGKDGRLFLDIDLSSRRQAAVLSTQPAAPRVQFLPLLAEGQVGSVSYHSEIELINHSRFPGSALVEGLATYDPPGVPVGLSRWVFLNPGATTRVTAVNTYSLARGYAKVTVEGGATISASISIKLQQQSQLLSTAVIEAVDPATLWDAQVDRESTDAAFAVSNPQDVPGLVTLELLDADGNIVTSHARILSPGQHFVFLIDDVFTSVPRSFVGRLRVSCEVPMLVGGLALAGARLSGILAKPAVPASSAYLFPTVACLEEGGYQYHSAFVMHNPDVKDAVVKVFLHESSGKLRETRELNLAAGQTKVIPIEEESPYIGWARVEVTGGKVVVNQRLQFFEGGELRSQMQLAPGMPKNALYFSAPPWTWDPAPGALAIVNPNDQEQEVWVDVLLPGWEIAVQERVMVPANGRHSYYLSELFGKHVPYSSLVRVRSASPVAVSSFTFYGLCMVPSAVF